MDVKSRSVPERQLALIGKVVRQSELVQFIVDSFVELFEYVSRNPHLRPLDTTPEWPTYCIYHGEVSAEKGSLVEACIVVAGDAIPEGDIQVRTDPAHDEAYLEIPKRMLEYPEVLEPYHAVAGWVRDHGEIREDMPCREVYVDDVLVANPDVHVCDVTYPYHPRG